ncbi:Putative ribosomal N-acetyltransferase YdaF [uncultured Roseburia sp.]|uniref:GNAT family N-acetyltransferase n=1 Tax=Brotonthovivens ammoniilytica TaxID=2981725 RepID=A0ABT2TM68_9FIRM|nr:GNAT family N-acetyltransferase [Brotonthovivens ammoniilytica]MCU6763308.1 GNAT family N-acetyltransferase [Brotonthovivens ammoniilytica]SCJ12763.1 Putative ribosomal N-acetyltransferase YdaF [uncultured Roseburia sp.]
MKNILETDRLILRPWKTEDAGSLYELAKDERVGPAAGWPVHTSVENSRDIIQQVLSAEGTYAVVLKEDGRVAGSAGLLIGKDSNFALPFNEAEIGYWIGVPYWGKGLIPEAVRELVRYAFQELGLVRLWCGYFDGNEQSRRVQEKCGFCHYQTNKDQLWDLTGEIKTEHISVLEEKHWREKA